MAKFIQLVGTGNHLFALDAAGFVWQFIQNEEVLQGSVWVCLPMEEVDPPYEVLSSQRRAAIQKRAATDKKDFERVEQWKSSFQNYVMREDK